MSKDIKSDVFSFDVFRYLWYKSNLLGFILPYSNVTEGVSLSLYFSDTVAHITCYRRIFFQTYLTQLVKNDADSFSKSGIDFYLFFKDNVDNFFPNKEMEVFDKIFMSLAFAVEMCYWTVVNQGTFDFMHFTPYCWNLYFQTELLEQFHEDGGWDQFALYAEFYKQSKLFDLDDSVTISFNKYGFVNVKELLKASLEEYNQLEIIEYFKENLQQQKHQGSKFCLHCLPLFTALSSLTYSDEHNTFNCILIEGYLQLLCLMLSDEDMTNLEISIAKGLKSEISDLFHNNFPDREILSNLSTEEKKVHEMEEVERELIIALECKKSATKILIERLFDEAPLKLNDSGCSLKSNQLIFNNCIFCSREVCLTNKQTRAEPLGEKLNLIKSVICSTTKASSEENSFKQQLKSVDQLDLDNHSLTEETSRDEKDALRMFFVLGIEPGRTIMLNALKQEQLKLVTEDLSKLKLEENLKKNRKNSKKKH